MRTQKRWLLAPLLVGLFHAASCNHGFIYDDYQLIVEATPLSSVADVAGVFTEPHCPQLPYYRPLAKLSLLVQMMWDRDSAWHFHLVNAAILAGCTWLAVQLLGDCFPRLPRSLCAVGALTMGVHPIMTAATFHAASGRETALMLFFMLLALTLSVRRSRGAPWFTGLAFAGALLSKEQAIVIPVLVLWLDLARHGFEVWRRRPLRAWAARYVPLLLVAALYLPVRGALFDGQEWVVQASAMPVLAMLYAAQVTVLPWSELRYEPSTAAAFDVVRVMLSMVAIAALWLITRSRRPSLRPTSDSQQSDVVPARMTSMWLLIGMTSLLPAAHLLQQEAAFDERWSVLVPLALVACLLAAISSVLDRDEARHLGRDRRNLLPWRRWVPHALLLAIAFCLAPLAWQRGQYHRDSNAFCTQWLATDPSSLSARTHLAYLDYVAGRHVQSAQHYHAAVAIAPRQGRLWADLGNALLAQERLPQAAWVLGRAIRLDPSREEPQRQLGNVLVQLGRHAEAVEWLDRWLTLEPGDVVARYARGTAAMHLGRYRQAQLDLQEVLRQQPQHVGGMANLGIVLAVQGQRDAAAALMRQALVLDPGNERIAGNLQRLHPRRTRAVKASDPQRDSHLQEVTQQHVQEQENL